MAKLSTRPGAPCLDFQTWDITKPNLGYLWHFMVYIKGGIHSPQSVRLYSYFERIPQNAAHPRLSAVINAMIPREITQYWHHAMRTSLWMCAR
jgi:hypothetical protein